MINRAASWRKQIQWSMLKTNVRRVKTKWPFSLLGEAVVKKETQTLT